MTQVVVGVRLNADGSGLIGQLKLSGAELDRLRVAEKGAAEAARDLSQATGGAGSAAQGAAASARDAAAATNAFGAAGRSASTSTREMGGVLDRAAVAVGQVAVEARKGAFALSDLSEKSQAQVRAQKQAADASTGLTRNIGLQRAGWQQVGFQMQDVFASYASGSRLSVIFAQQSGQLASAITLIAQSAEGGKGKLAGLASFLGGPWGIAIGVGVSVVGALAASLSKAGSSAEAAKAGASGLADAQSVLGDVFDLTSGKIKTQNALLLANARLMGINLRAEAATGAVAKMTGTAVNGGVPAGWVIGDDGKAFDPQETIIVEPKKPDILKELKSGFREGFEGVFDDLKGGLKTIFNNVFGDTGIFNKSLGKTLGRIAGYGAVGGAAGGLVTGALGVRGSGTGGMVGGAIGGELGEKFLTKGLESTLKGLGDFAGPLGSIAGGIIGSVVGGMLKKTKTGSANITSVDGDATLSGNSGAFKKAAGGAAESVQDGLSQIASTLGGAIGAFNVSIGQRHGDWRVRTGTGSLKIAKGATEFDDDQAGAIAYAIQLAVSQGAVTGISAAIDKALRSSTDIDEALTEALKVQEVEQLLGGLGSEMAKQFRAFEAQAKDRLQIATNYGFDVVEIEKRNAEDRAAAFKGILADRVGSLQSMLDDMKFGNLAEGSAMDQRAALIGQIAATRGEAEEGKDGAADRLAALARSLVDLSRESLGTAGSEYAADRSTAINAAEAVIKAENDRIKAAQDMALASQSELKNIAAATNQGNELLSRIASGVENLGVNASVPAPALDYSSLVRQVDLGR